MSQLEKKCLRGSDEDRLSNLPDLLLLHILSFLSTKDAVITSSLSLRWRNLWKSVPCLDVDTGQFYEENDFINFMDKFLHLHGDLYLQKCIVKRHTSAPKLPVFNPYSNRAIKFGKDQTPQWIYVKEVQMPRFLFICRMLVVLKLEGVILDVPECFSLPSLKIMHLEGAIFADDLAFKSLVSGCPFLEELGIVGRSEVNLKVLSIRSQTLKKLSTNFKRFRDGEGCRVVIDTPRLEYLNLKDRQSSSVVIKNLGLSFEADIDLNFEYGISSELPRIDPLLL